MPQRRAPIRGPSTLSNKGSRAARRAQHKQTRAGRALDEKDGPAIAPEGASEPRRRDGRPDHATRAAGHDPERRPPAVPGRSRAQHGPPVLAPPACPKKPLEMPLHSGGGDAVIRRIGRRAGSDGGVDGHNTPPNPREGDFRLIPLFVGLPPLGGDALFGASFSSWQDASSLPSPMSDAAAPNVLPFALSGASPSLHARHEEQRFYSYSSRSNGCIGGIATTRRGG
jgi:hypothetical protein